MLGDVLIIDDSKMDRFIVEKMIERSLLADRIENRELASLGLQYLQHCMESGQRLPNVIFLDINMPEMSGFDFLEAFDQFPPEIKKDCFVVMLTSSLNEDDREKAMSYEAVRMYCSKPISLLKLQELDEMLSQCSVIPETAIPDQTAADAETNDNGDDLTEDKEEGAKAYEQEDKVGNDTGKDHEEPETNAPGKNEKPG